MLSDFSSSNHFTLPTCFRKKHDPLKHLISTVLISTGANVMVAGSVLAQEIPVEEILVQDIQRDRYLVEESSVGKYTEPLLNTPQAVTTISSQMLEDRNAMSLDDALRNVPGITLGAGEFSWQGNNPTIRGFSSRNDMFLDGMRDTGNYARDPFNLESVEVLLGPSSMVFGRGSTGGVINQSTKKPVADEIRSLHMNVGNAGTRRATVDFNQPLQIGENAGFRVNLLAHEQDVPGRDVTTSERYGIAPSLSLGLGSATQLTLGFLHLESDSVPDYGLPWIENRPANVERESFYGYSSDYMDTRADVGSLIIDHRLNRDWTLNAQIRLADYSRHSFITEPQVAASVLQSDPAESVTVHRMIFTGGSTETMEQGQVNLRGDFRTGDIELSLIGGVEVPSESSDPTFGFASRTPFFDYNILVPVTTLANPVGGIYTGTTAVRLTSDTSSDTLAAYVLDTLKFGDHWQLSAGLRRDRFKTDYAEQRFDVVGNQTSSAAIRTRDVVTSYRTAVVYKPVEAGTVYLGWGTSFNPSGESISFISSGRGLNTSNVSLEPEKNESVELGTKWSLADDHLFVDASVFRIKKTNARVPDPLNPGFNTLAGVQEIKGLSVNISSFASSTVQLTGGYTYLDDEQRNTITGGVSAINNVAANTFSFWANWLASSRLSMGGGARYVDSRLVSGSKFADDYWALDAMAKFEYSDTLTLKLNLTNITNEYYFDQLHPWHVVPGPGFAAVFAVNLDY